MARPSTNAPIVAFEDSALGSATSEFTRFSPKTADRFFRHLTRVASGKIDHWTLQEFTDYAGIPFYKAEIGGEIMIYAVEEQSLGDRKVTVMLCGKRGVGCTFGGYKWDGQDVDALKQNVILSRAKAWFT